MWVDDCILSDFDCCYGMCCVWHCLYVVDTIVGVEERNTVAFVDDPPGTGSWD